MHVGVAAVWSILLAFASGTPHILFIVADDLGWDDLGFRSHQIRTPNIDKIGAEGVILDQYYVQSVCSPSRAAFMTGTYPLHNTINDWIPPQYSYGLPLNLSTVADKLGEAGYAAHAVGKWHLGFYKWAYTPTFRGFQSFYGYYSGGEDYYTHINGNAYDFRRDPSPRCGANCSEVAWQDKGSYSTHLFTSEAEKIIAAHDPSTPLFLYLAYQAVHSPGEVPVSYVEPYNKLISDPTRRNFAGMLSCLDEGVGNVTAALAARGMLNNTLVIFTSDNGGPTVDTPGGDYVGSVNYPLRGGKHSIWEGGTRVTAMVNGPMLAKRGYVNTNLMHGVDWMPTLLAAAGGQVSPPSNIDGIDQWAVISQNATTKRTEVLYGRQDDAPHTPTDNALRVGEYKYIHGWGGLPDNWSKLPGLSRARAGVPPVNASWLFNLATDPDEHNNEAALHKDIVQQLSARLDALLATGLPTAHNDSNCPPCVTPNDPHVGPVWAPWC